jgi:hypothetical protein
MEAPYWAARTKLAWATALVQRKRTADNAQIESLVSNVLAAAREYGFAGLERRATTLL